MSTLVTFAFGVIVILLTINPPDIIFFLNLFALGGLECSFSGLWSEDCSGRKEQNRQQSLVLSVLRSLMYFVIITYRLLESMLLYGDFLLVESYIFVIGNITCKMVLTKISSKNCFLNFKA